MTLIVKILAAMKSPFFPEINNLCLLPIKLLSITYKLISEANLVPNSGFIHIYTIEQVNKTILLYFNIKMAFSHAEHECSSCYLYTVIMYYITNLHTGYESIKSGTSFPLNIFEIELYIIIYVLVYFISLDGLLLFDKANNISDRSI